MDEVVAPRRPRGPRGPRGARGPRGPRSPRLLLTLLAVLLVVVVTTSLVLLHDRRDAAAVDAVLPADIGSPGWTRDGAGQAVVAARTAARTYFTLDHRRLKADMAAMRTLGTPEFVDQYDDRAPALARRIAAQDLVLTAAVPDDGAATEYLVADRAVVLVSVDVTTAKTGVTGTTGYRTRVALDLVEGRWLVASLDEVG